MRVAMSGGCFKVLTSWVRLGDARVAASGGCFKVFSSWLRLGDAKARKTKLYKA